jgi:starch synthase
VVASRGDALTPYLSAALGRRYPVVGRLDPELTSAQRYLVAAATFRPSRSRWVERFYKSELAYFLRSRNAAGQASTLIRSDASIFQVHALFEVAGVHTALYVDCTHRQSAESWPAWNPLRGRALERWYARERAAFHRAAAIFAFSEPTRRSLLKDYGVHPDRVSVVGAGANFIDLPTVPTRRPDPVVLFIGNDFVRKGGRVLLDAFKIVRMQIPSARLQLVGTHPVVGAQPGVEILGRIHDRAEVARIYSGARAFCLPSLFDPFPLVLLEAMAYGLPVVSSTSCGIPEIVVDGATGQLTEPGDVAAVASALIRLLEDPIEAARLGDAGRDRVERMFSWDRAVERMAPTLDRLLRPPAVSALPG